MLRDQAQHFLLGFLLFNTFCRSFTIDLDVDKNIQQNNFVTSIESSDLGNILIGQNVTLTCHTNVTDSIPWWTLNGENITDDTSYIQPAPSEEAGAFVSNLYILNINISNEGNYCCNAISNENKLINDTITINITAHTKILNISDDTKIQLHGEATLYCIFEGYPLSNLTWVKDDEESTVNVLNKSTKIETLNSTVKNSTLHLTELRIKDSGNYSCVDNTLERISKQIELLVLDKPQVEIDFIKALGTNTIFLNWTVNDGNDPETLHYTIQFIESGASNWLYYPEKISGALTYKLLENNDFKKNTTYSFRMEAENNQGTSQKSREKTVTTLSSNPEFIPEVKVTGVTVSSITISWSQLPQELHDHIHYYQLKLRAFNSTEQTEAIHSTPGDHFYMFKDLSAATTYEFQVAACSEYRKKCGPWSKFGNGTTLDGISDPPVKVNLTCRFDNISHTSFVFVSWKPPINPNGKITHYNVVLEGGATFINENGVVQHITWGPKMTTVNENSLSTRFYNISANTNYTVKISAVTRTKKHGQHVVLQCTMPPTTPDKNGLIRYTWSKVEEQGKWLFKLYLPRVSERNGPICCYRIYLIRMESHKSIAELPSPEDLILSTYEEAHKNRKGGVYVAEMFSSDYFQSEIFLGDEQILNYNESTCSQCMGNNLQSVVPKLSAVKVNATAGNNGNKIPSDAMKESTSGIENLFDVTTEPMQIITEKNINSLSNEFILPNDGLLDSDSNYTGFIEIVVHGNNKGEFLTAYSNYFNVLTPGPTIFEAATNPVLGIVVQILCVLILIVLVLLVALCLLHRYTKQVAHAQGVEMITFRNSFRHLCRSLRGRHRLVSVNPPDMNSIPSTDLASVYMDRHKDSDYGFQREFELLPDRFSDRTTRASDARENIYKNRYPDIKAYDQTRVKLAQIDSIAGSDYINANYVVGYKERKKFICAQGPMDNTVCDFWRMIWEQRLELILMLTNLEEYSKTKCAKYWPDKAEGEKVFGDYTVTHQDEKRYSDYIVRNLCISKTVTGRDKEDRMVTQYHFLVWKDFMAPEHPHGIIKFIKRINEAYSLVKGSILVHCSAGVGRTGTLVALDSLLQQLNEEKQVAIFNTIVDLRHQRNFLVQSLKQYIFIYRALMEVALYGDTEITAIDLKVTIDKLKQNGKNRCKMEEDFENIKNVVEDKKSSTVGSGSENLLKNRNPAIIPYDRNRVILTPIPGREHSTYINASFIEGYDNSESFIITQDPLESTINDFWRMISEQNINIIVMLSSLGEDSNKCPRYWPDDEINYDHISVKYIQSESCPYYTHREFIVTNNKSDEVNMVTQFQYHGWPTVEGEVPEVTRGLIELVDQTQNAQEQNGFNGPIVVHCNFGAERSSMFVGLSILVQQLRVEKRVDIFTTVRKLKSQRQEMISTFAQYEFLHRAIVNYSDLHQLSDNS